MCEAHLALAACSSITQPEGFGAQPSHLALCSGQLGDIPPGLLLELIDTGRQALKRSMQDRSKIGVPMYLCRSWQSVIPLLLGSI